MFVDEPLSCPISDLNFLAFLGQFLTVSFIGLRSCFTQSHFTVLLRENGGKNTQTRFLMEAPRKMSLWF